MIPTKAPYRVYHFSQSRQKMMISPVARLEFDHKNNFKLSHVWVRDWFAKAYIHQECEPPFILMKSTENLLDRYGRIVFEGDVLGYENEDAGDERLIIAYDPHMLMFTGNYYSRVPLSSPQAKGNKNAWWGEGYEPELYRRNKSPSGRLKRKILGNICEKPELLGYPVDWIKKVSSIKELEDRAWKNK